MFQNILSNIYLIINDGIHHSLYGVSLTHVFFLFFFLRFKYLFMSDFLTICSMKTMLRKNCTFLTNSISGILRPCRSSPPQLLSGKGVLKISSKFIGEHTCRKVISIKLQVSDSKKQNDKPYLTTCSGFEDRSFKYLISSVSGSQIRKSDINPFHTTSLFPYPLKTSENLQISDVFSRYKKRPVACNGLKKADK